MKRRTALVVAALTFGLTLGMGPLGLGAASAAEITVATHFEGPEGDWLRAAAKAFAGTAAGRGHTINIVNVPFGDIKQKMIQGKGDAADLAVSLPQDQIGEMITAGVLEPMDAYMTASGRSDLTSGALKAFTYKGKLFGLPMFGEAVAVVYNKKLIQTFPKTWDEFIKVAQSLTKPESQQFGFLANIENQYHMAGFFHAFGAYVFKDNNGMLDPKDIGLANAGAVRAGQLINDLRFRYKLIPEGASDDGLMKDLFVNGKLAMWQTGPWSLGDIKRAGVDYGIALLPKPTGATRNWAPFLGVQGVVMNAYSKNKRLAADFAKYLVTSENQMAFNKTGGRVPVSKKAVKALETDPVVAGFSKAIAAGIPLPNLPEMGQVWGPWGNAVTLIAKTANANIADLLTKAVNEIRSNIK